MLVLSRKEDESIVITCGKERITIFVARLTHDQVRLGIEAKRHVIIHRGEIQALIDSGDQLERNRA